MILQGWHLPSQKKLHKWIIPFLSSEEVFHLSEPCLLCGETALYRWYFVNGPQSGRPGFSHRGSAQLWCTACRAMAHFSCYIPDWWIEKMGVAADGPTPYPADFEEALARSLSDSEL